MRESHHPDELIDALDTLGVRFLSGGTGHRRTFSPAILLSALAADPEARLRMALIPLLLAHPEFAEDVHTAERRLPTECVAVLRCYYTAAHWLQVKHHEELTALMGVQPTLPDFYGDVLGVTGHTSPDSALQALSLRQQQLTGISLNWQGTYEHAAQSWLRFRKQEVRWQALQPSESTNS